MNISYYQSYLSNMIILISQNQSNLRLPDYKESCRIIENVLECINTVATHLRAVALS